MSIVSEFGEDVEISCDGCGFVFEVVATVVTDEADGALMKRKRDLAVCLGSPARE